MSLDNLFNGTVQLQVKYSNQYTQKCQTYKIKCTMKDKYAKRTVSHRPGMLSPLGLGTDGEEEPDPARMRKYKFDIDKIMYN